MPLYIVLKLRGPMKKPMQFLIVNMTPPPTYTWTTDITLATDFFNHFNTDPFYQANPELSPIAQNFTST